MTDTEVETPQAQKDRLLGQAYSAATTRLREQHKTEFNTYYSNEAAVRGIEWSPRLSKEEKALADIEKLLEDNPSLAERLAERLAAKTAS